MRVRSTAVATIDIHCVIGGLGDRAHRPLIPKAVEIGDDGLGLAEHDLPMPETGHQSERVNGARPG
jgi:hypothetical protein